MKRDRGSGLSVTPWLTTSWDLVEARYHTGKHTPGLFFPVYPAPDIQTCPEVRGGEGV